MGGTHVGTPQPSISSIFSSDFPWGFSTNPPAGVAKNHARLCGHEPTKVKSEPLCGPGGRKILTLIFDHGY